MSHCAAPLKGIAARHKGCAPTALLRYLAQPAHEPGRSMRSSSKLRSRATPRMTNWSLPRARLRLLDQRPVTSASAADVMGVIVSTLGAGGSRSARSGLTRFSFLGRRRLPAITPG
jgi:hypothetical protein